MKRSSTLLASATTGALTLLATTPAFAEEYYGGDDAAGLAFCGAYMFCILIPLIVMAVFNIWMLIDAIMRQEYEYPNSSGNSKLIWILLLVFVGLIAAVVYYFMVFRKIKRGSGPASGIPAAPVGYQPPAAPPVAPPAPPAPPAAPAAPAPPAPPAPPASPQGPTG